MSIKWDFPLSYNAEYDGFNNSGIATFTGARFDNLAREIIQNSLDASNDDSPKVTVKFEFLKIKRAEFPGADGLLDVMERCLKEQKSKKKVDAKAVDFFKKSIGVLQADEIACLRISDVGTTGLRGDYRNSEGEWHTITKAQGVSVKEPTAGGSFGIGKNATFTVSVLRTVFYSTLYKDERGKKVTLAQGKSILVAHKTDSGECTRGTGFYGEEDQYMPIEKNLPGVLCPKEQGCVILVAGFVAGQNWAQKIMAAVVANFFCAINDGKLDVLIQDESKKTEKIQKTTLDACFEKIKQVMPKDDEVENSHHYYQVMKSPDKTLDKQFSALGHCKIMLLKQEGLPKRVALVRKTGMLITDEQKRLKQWSSCADFAAVVVCDSDKGNELLRSMENPQHNAFEPDQIEDSDQRKKASEALRSLIDWIKEQVFALAQPEVSEMSSVKELNQFFHDLDAAETIDEDEKGRDDEREQDIEGAPVYAPRPMKKVKPKPEPVPDGDDNGDAGGADESDDGKGGKGGKGSGRGKGGGSGGSGNKESRQPFKLQNIRVVPDGAGGDKKIVYFTPEHEGVMQLSLAISGDDGNAEAVAIVDATGPKETDVKVDEGNVSMHFNKPSDQGAARIALRVTLAKSVNESLAVNAFGSQRESKSEGKKR